MRVFRRRHTPGFSVLLVLAMQLSLVFAQAHVHTAPFASVNGLATRAITFGMCRIGTERTCPAPGSHGDGSHEDGKCEICSAIGLAGAGLLSVTTPVLVRQIEAAPPAPLRMAALVQEAGSAHFQARAPPHRAI
jgi:hypothetical protein